MKYFRNFVAPILIPLLSLSFWGPLAFMTSAANLAFAQESASSVELAPQTIKENGCPVDITSAKAFLDLNSFGKPEYSRVYITYKNVSGKNVYSVNFRVRFTNQEGANLGTFQGSRTATVTPDGEGSEKWKKAGGINPAISSYKVRVLQVKFEDGSQWDSEAVNNVGRTQQQNQEQQQQQQEQDYEQGGNENMFQPAQQPIQQQQPVQQQQQIIQQQAVQQQPVQQQQIPAQPLNLQELPTPVTNRATNQGVPTSNIGPGPDVAPDQYLPPPQQQAPGMTPEQAPQQTPQQAPQETPQQAPAAAPGQGPVFNPNDNGEDQGDAFSR